MLELRVLRSCNQAELEMVAELGNSWLRHDYSQETWNHGGFHYVRPAAGIAELIESFKMKVISAWENRTLVGYAFLFDEMIPLILGDPEFGNEPWIHVEDWPERVGDRAAARIGYYYHCAAASGHTGLGIGSFIHDAAIKQSREAGLTGLVGEILEAPAINRASMDFHLNRGWLYRSDWSLDDEEFDPNQKLVWAEIFYSLI